MVSEIEVEGADLIIGCVYKIHFKFWYNGKVIPNGGIFKYGRFEKSILIDNTFYRKNHFPLQLTYVFRLLEDDKLFYTYVYHATSYLRNKFYLKRIPVPNPMLFSLVSLAMFNTSTYDIRFIRQNMTIPFINQVDF